MPLSEHDLRNVMDEQSTVPAGSAHRPGRLEEVHKTIRQSRRRRTTAAAVAGAGALAVAVLAGPALLPNLGLVETVRDGTAVQPANGTGRTEDTKSESEQAKPFEVRLDDLADAEKLAERLRGLGIEAVAVDEVLDVSDPSAVLGDFADGTIRRQNAPRAGLDFTIDPAAITDGRIIVAMGLVDDLHEGKVPISWQRPIIIHERAAKDVQCASSRGNGPDADERAFHVYVAGQAVPAPTCPADGSGR